MPFTADEIVTARNEVRAIIIAENSKLIAPAAMQYLRLFIEAAQLDINKRAANPNTTTLVPPELTEKAKIWVQLARSNQNVAMLRATNASPTHRAFPRCSSPVI